MLIEPVCRDEGTVARLMGDAMLAFSGAPIAHEDASERAVRAVLENTAGVQTYAEELERERGIRRMRRCWQLQGSSGSRVSACSCASSRNRCQ
jgi:class 3 adenylate cyclase